jgi:hypothetical protein
MRRAGFVLREERDEPAQRLIGRDWHPDRLLISAAIIIVV